MATRRPPMPRAGSGGSGNAPQKPPAGEPASTEAPRRPRSASTPAPAEALKRPRTPAAAPAQQQRTAPEPRLAKVIPLGRISEEHPEAAAPSKPKPVAAPAKAPKNPAGVKPKAAKHASGDRPKSLQPGNLDSTADQPKTKKKPKKHKSSDSERRIEDRALLSGAVRKDEKAAKKQGKKDPEGPAKPIPARSFSGRILALSIAMSVFALLLVPSIGTYARQHEEIAVLRSSIAAKEAERDELKDQIARWDDPLYIKQQARDRINLVMPGERNYMVVGSKPTDTPPTEENHSPDEIRTDLPWVDALFDSVQRAATD